MKNKYLFIWLAAFVLQPAKSQNAYTPPDSALIACYSFNGNAFDASGNGNHGIVNGAVSVTDRFGSSNSAYMFNGSGTNIVVPGFNTKISSNEFSLSFWATSNLYATRSAFLLVPDDPSNRLNVHIYYGNQPSNSQTFFDWGDIYSGGRLYIAASPLPAPGMWDHWVFINSGLNNTIECYKNGTLIYAHAGCSSLATSGFSRDLLIGGGVGVDASYLWFNGSIDDVKIFGRVLTAADISALYTQTVSCKRIVPTNIINSAHTTPFTVSPNPCNSVFRINELDSPSEVIITSITGKQIASYSKATDKTAIDISEYESGIYFLTIKNASGIYKQKLIRE